ncbi:ABC transporter permease [Chloroflexota bacterium]
MLVPSLTAASAVVMPILAILLALAFGALVMAISGIRPLEGYQAIFRGAFGGPARVGVTVTKATPLILAGLAVALPLRCGLINLGAEGQVYIGAMTATLAAVAFPNLPWAVHMPLVIAAGFAGGALWGAIPGWMRARLHLNELITTIMLSYIAFWIVSYLVHGPMKDPAGGGYPWSIKVPESAVLPIIIKQYRINLGIVLALAAAAISHFLLWRTTLGFEMRAVGAGPLAARMAGINAERTTVLTFAIGGGMAGMAGMAEIMGVQFRLSDFFSPGYGWDGVVVAMAGQANPLGVVLIGLFFGALRNGAESASRSIGMPASISLMIQASTLLFVVASNSLVLRRTLSRRRSHAPDTGTVIPVD